MHHALEEIIYLKPEYVDAHCDLASLFYSIYEFICVQLCFVQVSLYQILNIIYFQIAIMLMCYPVQNVFVVFRICITNFYLLYLL